MTSTRFDLTLPEGTWLADVTRAHPRSTFRIRATVGDDVDGRSRTLLSVVTTDAETVLDDVASHDDVVDVDEFDRSDCGITLHVTGSTPRFIASARRTGLPLELPVEAADGVVSLRATAGCDRLSEFGRQLSAAGMRIDLRSVGDHERDGHLLTDTQRALLIDAVQRGYYDTPRECSLTDLADANGIAKSTCSETLHRAEGRVLKHFAAGVSIPDESTEDDSSPAEHALRASG